MRRTPAPGVEVSLAGQRLDVATPEEIEALERREAQARLKALGDWLEGGTGEAQDDARGGRTARAHRPGPSDRQRVRTDGADAGHGLRLAVGPGRGFALRRARRRRDRRDSASARNSLRASSTVARNTSDKCLRRSAIDGYASAASLSDCDPRLPYPRPPGLYRALPRLPRIDPHAGQEAVQSLPKAVLAHCPRAAETVFSTHSPRFVPAGTGASHMAGRRMSRATRTIPSPFHPARTSPDMSVHSTDEPRPRGAGGAQDRHPRPYASQAGAPTSRQAPGTAAVAGTADVRRKLRQPCSSRTAPTRSDRFRDVPGPRAVQDAPPNGPIRHIRACPRRDRTPHRHPSR